MSTLVNLIIDILSEPSVVVGLIAVLGLILQKKHFTEVISGGIKTFAGFLIILAGSDIVSGALNPFGSMFDAAFDLPGVVAKNEAVISVALQEFGVATAFIMLFGMIFNMVIARFTRFKYIYLTGHATFYKSAMMAVILSVAGFTNIPLIIVGGLIIGIANCLYPALLQPFMRNITNNNEIALGHTGSVGFAASALFGKIVGKNSKSTEEIEFPKSFAFLRDSTVSMTIVMSIIYLILSFVVGFDYITSELSGGTNPIVFAVQQSGTFAAGIFVVLAGVRLVLAEIVPAFRGISEKLVPNAKPALDCPVVFPFAKNAVMIGFLFGFLGNIIAFFIQLLLGTTVIVPGPRFFSSATAGVFGNSTGGIRGAILGSLLNGILMPFFSIMLMPLLGQLGFAESTFSDTDYAVTGILFGGLGELGGRVAIVAGVIVVLIAMFVITYLMKNRDNQLKVQGKF